MARYLGPKKKLMRRFGMLEDGRKTAFKSRKSDYGLMLDEKQKLKFIYGIFERQLKNYIEKAQKMKGNPVENLLILLEKRLDNVVFRLGFAQTRPQARQMVSHRHILVDGKKVNIASYQVQTGQNIAISGKISESEMVIPAVEMKKPQELPSWLIREDKSGKILGEPKSDDLRKDIDMVKVIEFYSR